MMDDSGGGRARLSRCVHAGVDSVGGVGRMSCLLYFKLVLFLVLVFIVFSL